MGINSMICDFCKGRKGFKKRNLQIWFLKFGKKLSLNINILYKYRWQVFSLSQKKNTFQVSTLISILNLYINQTSIRDDDCFMHGWLLWTLEASWIRNGIGCLDPWRQTTVDGSVIVIQLQHLRFTLYDKLSLFSSHYASR